MKIKYTPELMGFMSVFQRTTHARLKDCFIDTNSNLTFVVETGELRKALGDKAMNIRRLEKSFNRKVKVMEFNMKIERFMENLVYPSKLKEVTVENNIITLTPVDSKTRGYLIGRAASNLRNYEPIVKRYFREIKEIKVI